MIYATHTRAKTQSVCIASRTANVKQYTERYFDRIPSCFVYRLAPLSPT